MLSVVMLLSTDITYHVDYPEYMDQTVVRKIIVSPMLIAIGRYKKDSRKNQRLFVIYCN